MEYADFVEALTSKHAHWENVGGIHFTNRMKLLASVGQQFDDMKKAIFYGRQDLYTCLPNEDPMLPRENAVLFHAALGLVTEAIELLEGILKNDKINVMEELGDLKFYLQMGTNAIGATDKMVEDGNRKKLQQRYGAVFSKEAANNRNLDAERKALGG